MDHSSKLLFLTFEVYQRFSSKPKMWPNSALKIVGRSKNNGFWTILKALVRATWICTNHYGHGWSKDSGTPRHRNHAPQKKFSQYLEIYGSIFFAHYKSMVPKLWKLSGNTFAILHCDFKFENTNACSKHMLKTRVAPKLWAARNWVKTLK